MAGETHEPKPFYKDREDTLEDVGITAKQLRTWREAGLFVAELGPSTRKFTIEDIDQLRFLKKLIVELGLPIQTVQRLMANAPSTYSIPLSVTYLDINRVKLVRPKTALAELIEVYAATSDLKQLEDWVLTLTLRWFQIVKDAHPSSKVYAARRDEFLDQIRHLDLVARAVDPQDDVPDVDPQGNEYWPAPRFSPPVPGDPDPQRDLLTQLAFERYQRLRGITRVESLVQFNL